MSARLCLIRDFIKLVKSDLTSSSLPCPANHENSHSYVKLNFHRLGKQVLRAVAKEMGLQSGTYEIRSNLGGWAVSGEVTLHGEHIYIQLSQTVGVLYRSCRGRMDFTGGDNNWMEWEKLYNLPRACEEFKRVTI